MTNEKLSVWFDTLLKKKIPHGVTVVYIDTADLPYLINGIKELERAEARLAKAQEAINHLLNLVPWTQKEIEEYKKALGVDE